MGHEKPEFSPLYIWEELHLWQGESAFASAMAEFELRHFDPQKANPLMGEYARIAAVTAWIAMGKSDNQLEVLNLMMRVLSVQADYYPYGIKAAEAIARGNAWEPAYEDESAQTMCLHDTLHFLSGLGTMFKDKRIPALAGGIVGLLQRLPGVDDRYWRTVDDPKEERGMRKWGWTIRRSEAVAKVLNRVLAWEYVGLGGDEVRKLTGG